MKSCCFQHLDSVKRIGRANYVCPICNSNVTLAMIFLYESENPQTDIHEINKNKDT